jgi:uncharacterized RDD family membrane protein YckC
MNWYYALNGQQQGPVTEQDLAQLASTGSVQPTTLVWREGMGDWQPLSVALPGALRAGAAPAAEVPQIGGYAIPSAQKDIVVQQLREGVSPAALGAMDYAGFWIRFGAKFIDGLIHGAAMLVIVGLVALLLWLGGALNFEDFNKPGAEPSGGFIVLGIVYYAVALLWGPLYAGYFVAKYGATWGKMAVGIKVVNEDGSKPSTGKAYGRGFAEMINGFTCNIGYIIAGFDSEKRGLHDHICSTRVIKTR